VSDSGRNTHPVLVHAAKGDPNRTWPKERWERLIHELQGSERPVALIGNAQADPERGVHDFAISGVLDLVNRLSLPGLEALLRRSALLVTTDSGPVQLAGATDIPIVGLYTVVAGRCRLPYRQGFSAWNAVAVEPACPHAPCYAAIPDCTAQAAFQAKTGVDPSNVPALFSKWCQAAEPYRCL
jgi:ADP-heptose:LPS heptosyltransferase